MVSLLDLILKQRACNYFQNMIMFKFNFQNCSYNECMIFKAFLNYGGVVMGDFESCM
jgi:hypothetical protein